MIGASRSAPVSPRLSGRKYADVLAGPGAGPSRKRQRVTHDARPHTSSPSLGSSTVTSPCSRTFHPDASLVLVGIRGCGKRSLGFIAATALGRRFITEDRYFQTATGLSRQEYLRQYGSHEFHKKDIEVLEKMLEENRTKCVIECGLGSLTSSVQDHLQRYATTNPVVYLVRDMREIKRHLRLADHAARLLENVDPSHRHCSNFEFYNLEDGTSTSTLDNLSPDRRSPTYPFKLKHVKEDFSHFVRFVTSSRAARNGHGSAFSLSEVPIERRLYTHTLEIPFSSYLDHHLDLAQLESGGDAAEIMVDRWRSSLRASLSKMVAEVRRKLAVPIIWSAVLDEASDAGDYLAIMEQGLRLGVDFLSVDLHLENRHISSLVACQGHTRIIGTFCERPTSTSSWNDLLWLETYERAQMLDCDLVRLVRTASSRQDNDQLNSFVHRVQQAHPSGPRLIAYNVGTLGRTSQIFNTILTPVTHDALRQLPPSPDVPPCPPISSREAIQALFGSFILDPLIFCVLGAEVSGSFSPLLHNAAYMALGMSHRYTAKNITSFTDFEVLAENPNFGGGSIAQPWKVSLVSKLTALSRHAETIGAVNTLIPLRADDSGNVPSLVSQASQRNRAGRIAGWYGDNTDWLGITVCLNRNIAPRNVIRPSKTTALIIGAGGMARAAIYALLQMGCRHMFIHNRTLANAQRVVAHFNAWAASSDRAEEPTHEYVRVLPSMSEDWPTGFEMPSIIISCVTQENIRGQTAANFQVPTQWLHSLSGGVVVEMAYAVTETPLVKQIQRLRQETGLLWVVVDFLEILPEQAVAQFELMTGRKAPVQVMRQAVLEGMRERISRMTEEPTG